MERATLSAALLILLVLLGAPVAAQEKAPERGFRPAGSYALSDIETISTTSGNLMLRVPLAKSLPRYCLLFGWAISLRRHKYN